VVLLVPLYIYFQGKHADLNICTHVKVNKEATSAFIPLSVNFLPISIVAKFILRGQHIGLSICRYVEVNKEPNRGFLPLKVKWLPIYVVAKCTLGDLLCPQEPSSSRPSGQTHPRSQLILCGLTNLTRREL
jgi:hypothetical protein